MTCHGKRAIAVYKYIPAIIHARGTPVSRLSLTPGGLQHLAAML